MKAALLYKVGSPLTVEEVTVKKPMIAEKAADMISRRSDDTSGTSGLTARSTRGQQGIDMPVTTEVSSTGDAAFTQHTIRSSTEARKRT
jgi:hypothetical protein